MEKKGGRMRGGGGGREKEESGRRGHSKGWRFGPVQPPMMLYLFTCKEKNV